MNCPLPRPLNNVLSRIQEHARVLDKMRDAEVSVLTPAELETLADISEKMRELRDRATARLVDEHDVAFGQLAQHLFVDPKQVQRMYDAGVHLLWYDKEMAKRQSTPAT